MKEARPTQIYRYFDADGALLYVGISRLLKHRAYSAAEKVFAAKAMPMKRRGKSS
jgi:excinuclease UvrABC nuclease subunit